MPKKVSKKQILVACQMSFHGTGNKEIASELGFTEATVCAWRKLELWQEFEAELIKACKEKILSEQDFGLESVTPS